jgi:hypothetical protein
MVAARLGSTNDRTGAPITTMLRPHPSMCLRHTFGPASLPGGAGIFAPAAREPEANR